MASAVWTAVSITVLLATACGSASDSEAPSAAAPPSDVAVPTIEPAVPAATLLPEPTVPRTASSCDQADLNSWAQPDRGDAVRMIARYAAQTTGCPDPDQLEELRYIWARSGAFWTEFPAQEERFFVSNLSPDGGLIRPDLIGLPVATATESIVTDPVFPMVLDSGPTEFGGSTFYEFAGGATVHLVAARDDTVTSIYALDQT